MHGRRMGVAVMTNMRVTVMADMRVTTAQRITFGRARTSTRVGMKGTTDRDRQAVRTQKKTADRSLVPISHPNTRNRPKGITTRPF